MSITINHGRVSHPTSESEICLVCLKTMKHFVESVLDGSLLRTLEIPEEEAKKNPRFSRIIEINKQ